MPRCGKCYVVVVSSVMTVDLSYLDLSPYSIITSGRVVIADAGGTGTL